MKYIKQVVFLLALISMPLAAFEFNNSTGSYDFSQTQKIHIVDQKNSKFFGMFDPFEMKVTTMPSRFYVAVMGVLERGHSNAEGVSIIEGKAVGYEFVLIFTSLNSSHVMFIGENWIIDGNKKILLLPEEIKAIYNVLVQRSIADQKRDMDQLEHFFEKIDDRQDVTNRYPQLTADDELKSIIESKNSIKERLPESHNDTQTLPYYNKALENQKFLEEYEKAKKLNEQKTLAKEQPNNISPEFSAPMQEKNASSATKKPIQLESSTPKQEQSLKYYWFFLGLFVGMGLLLFRWFKRVSHNA